MAMLVPVALVILQGNRCAPRDSSFGRALMIGLPFACLIGGVGTPAGSSMNAMTIGLLKDTANVNISFLEWACVGLPMVLITRPSPGSLPSRLIRPKWTPWSAWKPWNRNTGLWAR